MLSRPISGGGVSTGLYRVINVGDYGTDSAAITAAFAAVPASGATVFFPVVSGGYNITATVTNIPSHARIIGGGPGGHAYDGTQYRVDGVVLKAAAGLNAPIFQLGAAVYNVTFDDMNFDGNKANQTVAAPLVKMTAYGAVEIHPNIKFNKCGFLGAKGDANNAAVNIGTDGGASLIRDFIFSQCSWVSNDGGALYLTDGVVNAEVRGCVAMWNGISGGGCFSAIHSNFMITDGDFEQTNSGPAIYINGQGTFGTSNIQGNDIESANAGVYFTGNVNGLRICNNKIVTVGNYTAIEGAASSGFTIGSNELYQSGAATGKGIYLGDMCTDFMVQDNFINSAYAAKISMLNSANIDRFVITGNNTNGDDITIGTSVGAHRVLSNNGWSSPLTSLTKVKRESLTPTEGMMVYDATLKAFYGYSGATPAWAALGGGNNADGGLIGEPDTSGKTVDGGSL